MELNYNRVELRGVAEDAPLLSHVNHGCAFYRFTLSVLRLSGQADKLPVIVPRPLLLLTPVFFAAIGINVKLDGVSGGMLAFSVLLLVISVISKLAGCGLGAKLCGFTERESIQVGVGMV